MRNVKPSQLDLATLVNDGEEVNPPVNPISEEPSGDHSPAEAETIAADILAGALARVGRPDYEDFDWANDDAVILQRQAATAVYFNRYGGLVIRQEAAWDEESDPFMVISRENINAFLDGVAERIRRGD